MTTIDPRTAPLADVLRYVAERLEPSRHGSLWKRCPEQLGEVTHEVACRSGCRGTSRVTAPLNIGNLMVAARLKRLLVDVESAPSEWTCYVFELFDHRHQANFRSASLDEAVVRALALALSNAEVP